MHHRIFKRHIEMIRIVHQGLGPIGQGTARLVLGDSKLKIVGVLDINPEYIGKDLGDLLGISHLGIKVLDNAEILFSKTQPDVVVLATCSNLKKLMPSLKIAIINRVNIVSPAEELFYPEFEHKEEATYIDKLAKRYNVRVIGGAVNPGCLMDAFPLQVFRKNFDDLISMNIYRWDDTTERRATLLAKTGAGLSKEEFYALNKQGKLGHVGLRMSAAYLADKIGLKNYKIIFKREPIISEQTIKPKYGKTIQPKQVAGLHETCSIIIDGQQKISLDLRMYVGAKNKNSVDIVGIKNQNKYSKSIDYSNIVNGDISTTLILKDAISHVIKGPPGLNKINYVANPLTLLRK